MKNQKNSKLEQGLEREIKGLSYSFLCAFRGIRSCILGERNMRIHLAVSVTLLLFAPFYSFNREEFVLLLLTIALVIACEMLNTAVETIVDMISPSYHKLAKFAKDIAAGAVLICAAIACIIGFLLYWDLEIFCQIFVFFKSHPLWFTLFLLFVLCALCFIFEGFGLLQTKKHFKNHPPYFHKRKKS